MFGLEILIGILEVSVTIYIFRCKNKNKNKKVSLITEVKGKKMKDIEKYLKDQKQIINKLIGFSKKPKNKQNLNNHQIIKIWDFNKKTKLFEERKINLKEYYDSYLPSLESLQIINQPNLFNNPNKIYDDKGNLLYDLEQINKNKKELEKLVKETKNLDSILTEEKGDK